uniref:60S ribosomal protein L27 n=1 Tax=Cannabis sativa TaxID=3483 RepID=A0A803NTX7_CANSA
MLDTMMVLVMALMDIVWLLGLTSTQARLLAKTRLRSPEFKAFVKLVNYQHLMPTRYTLDADLEDVANVDVLQSKDKKVTALKETKKRFEQRFKTGKNRWFLLMDIFQYLLGLFAVFLND